MNALGRAPHAVVIGSGFGGLAAAIRLGARGYRVTVLEQLAVPGGRARVLKQDGFTFDAGPTIITAPFLFEELWRLCGRNMSDDVKLNALAHFYRIVFDDGGHFDCLGSEAAMAAEVKRVAPDDLAGYEAFMKHSEQIYRVGFEELSDVPFESFGAMMRIAPDFLRLRCLSTVYATAARYVRNPKLRFALSFHPLFVGGNPFKTTAVYCLISYLERKWGVHFPDGGTGALVAGLADLIAGQGNTIRYGAKVTEIVTNAGRATGVTLDSGETIGADIVVSNADATWTYNTLLRRTPKSRWSDRKLARASQSMSAFVWYFGTRRKYPEVPHHTILLGPRYEGLIADIFKHKILAEDFSLYVHRPTATDPTLAPEGCDTFYALAPVPNLASGTDWKRHAETYRQAISKRLSDRLLPGIESEIVTSAIFTPQDFQDSLSSAHGAAFGLEPILTQSAWFRPHNRSEDVERLYLVGAGTHPGAGVPGVLSSARILDSVVPDPHLL